MAATNYTPIKLYYSATASATPVSGNLAYGELAININDGKLYYKDNSNVVQVIANKGTSTIGGSNTQIQYNNAGALAGSAAMTFNSGTSTTTLTTLNLTNALGATYGGTAQSAYTQGDVLYASATNTLSKLSIGTVNYILTSTGAAPQWSAPSSIAVLTATNLAGGVGGSVPYQSAADTTTFLAVGAANRVMTSTGTAPQWVTALTGLTGVSSSSITNTSLTSGRVVLSSTAGLQADSANLTFNGTTLSTTGLSNTGFSTLVKTLTLGDANFNGTAVFAAATPAKMYMGTGTVTDVTSAASATNAVGTIASLAITPIAATNTAVTYTNASTLYIAGAPSAGTNVTITNPYSLYVAAGAAYFGGAVTFAGSLSLAGVTVTSLTDSGLTSGRVTYAGTGGLLQDSANMTFNGTVLTSSFAGPVAATTLSASSTVSGTGFSTYLASPPAIGGTAAAAGSFTTLSASSTTTLSGGTANGVAYLNGSKVLTTGTALVFDGSKLGVGTSTLNGTLTVKNPSITGNQVIFAIQAGTSTSQLASWDLNQTSDVSTFGTDYGAPLAFKINSAEQMRLTSTGLGIGTSSPSEKLHIYGASPYFLLQGSETSAQTLYIRENAGGLYFGQYGVATRMLLDSAGNLGLGVTPSAWQSVRRALQVGSNVALWGQASGAGTLFLSNNIYYDGTNFKYLNTSGASYLAQLTDGSFTFNSAASGTAGDPITFTQAMTLDSNGNLLVGATSTSITNGFAVIAASPAYAIVGHPTGTASGYAYMSFQYNASAIGSITQSGTTAVLYNVTSDQRLKENIVDAAPASDLIDSLQVRQFDWKTDNTHQRYGFVAQELVTVAPEAVHQPADPEEMMAVDYSKLVPMLVKEIQSLRKRLAAAGI